LPRAGISVKSAIRISDELLTERRAQDPIILSYHRIAERDSDPWGLAVAPDRFEEQLAVLPETRELFPMSAFLDLLESGRLPANAAAVTFDDGYADNLKAAKPRLQRAGAPATVFIATGYVGERREFWWDELARIILESDSAIDGEISVAGQRHHVRLRTKPRSTRRSTY
jgi:peptidoglycan/xylan/chitin deacetylase (PgdA/CDA1 family)